MNTEQSHPKTRYDLLCEVGSGSCARVYKASRKSDNKIVAIKILNTKKLDNNGIQGILNEVRILASISNPFIVEYYEAYVDDNEDTFWIVMEYIGGGDLASKIKLRAKNDNHFSEKQIWSYMIQMLRAIKELHKLKIVHRDIKPANIFLSEDGQRVKLGDMNVSKVLKNDLAQTQIGTPYYLAPEVWKREMYDFRADIFSLGVLLYELAALKRPFEANDALQLCMKVQNDSISRIPLVYSDDLNSFIHKCLIKEQVLRPTAIQLLNSRILRKNLKDFDLSSYVNDEKDECVLLKTIVPTQNLSNINNVLPNKFSDRCRSVPNSKANFAGLMSKINFGIKRLATDGIALSNVTDKRVESVKEPERSDSPQWNKPNTNGVRKQPFSPHYQSHNNPLQVNIKSRVEERLSVDKLSKQGNRLLVEDELSVNPPLRIDMNKNNIKRPPILRKVSLSKQTDEHVPNQNNYQVQKSCYNRVIYNYADSDCRDFSDSNGLNNRKPEVNRINNSRRQNNESPTPIYANVLKMNFNRDVKYASSGFKDGNYRSSSMS